MKIDMLPRGCTEVCDTQKYDMACKLMAVSSVIQVNILVNAWRKRVFEVHVGP